MTPQPPGAGVADWSPRGASAASGLGESGRRTQRDLLPLPRLNSEFCVEKAGLSRGVRQRVRRRQCVFEGVNEIVDALNLLAGKPQACVLEPSDAQLEALYDIEKAVRVHKPPEKLLSPEEAGHALLGPGRPYEGGASLSLGTYDATLISVPSVGSRPVDLAARLPEPARSYLIDFKEHILLNEEEMGLQCEQNNFVPCYTDPTLKRSRACYHDLVRKMHDGGLICFTQRPLCRVGAFCVKKKNGRLRLVIDCRGANRLFKPTPSLADGHRRCLGRCLLGRR
jgi:hypothetical protein